LHFFQNKKFEFLKYFLYFILAKSQIFILLQASREGQEMTYGHGQLVPPTPLGKEIRETCTNNNETPNTIKTQIIRHEVVSSLPGNIYWDREILFQCLLRKKVFNFAKNPFKLQEHLSPSGVSFQYLTPVGFIRKRFDLSIIPKTKLVKIFIYLKIYLKILKDKILTHNFQLNSFPYFDFARGLEYKISPPLPTCYFDDVSCRCALITRYTLRFNTDIIMKDIVLMHKNSWSVAHSRTQQIHVRSRR